MKILLTIFIGVLIFVISPLTFARTTPEDIIQERRQSYEQKLKNYSSESQVKLSEFESKIAKLNKLQTDILNQEMERQSELLEEYISRNNIEERQADGISRNLQDPVENARYWITYAHEAVAYQAAEQYIFNLSSQANIKGDVKAQINELNADMNILIGKVEKSRKIIQGLVS